MGESGAPALSSARRRAIDPRERPGVRVSPGSFPLEIAPELPGTRLDEWAASSRGRIAELLSRHGALAFTGFGATAPTDLASFAEAAGTALFADYGDLPRESAGDKVYGTTPYPPSEAILFHNESSHQWRFPRRIFFLALVVPGEGGATPLSDGRQALRVLSRPLAARLASEGLRYARTFTPGIDVAWTTFFRTDEKARVEERCRAEEIAWEWRAGGVLKIAQRAPAVVRHPATGEEALFHQVLLHHPSRLPAEVREALLSILPPDALPRDVTWGGGDPIADEDVDEIADALERHAVDRPWAAGDVLMVDNLLVAHGRRPYRGARRVVVAMGDMLSQAALRVTG